MRLDNSRESENIEDKRGSRMPMRGRGKIGLGAIVLALVAIYYGVDPNIVFQNLAEPAGTEQTAQTGEPASDAESLFVSKVLADTEDAWGKVFQQNGWGEYRQPKLVLFTGATSSACGLGQAAMGPFYCPGDSKVYLDLSFFRQMEQELNSPGDFAKAYVIAHEIGHHVQHLRGITDKAAQLKQRANSAQANRLSVQVELQADCFAGVWANRSNEERNTLETGDIEEALTAATAIGDDRLQKQAQGYAVPDSFTHGTSAQRTAWFTRGYKSGNAGQCDTFAPGAL